MKDFLILTPDEIRYCEYIGTVRYTTRRKEKCKNLRFSDVSHQTELDIQTAKAEYAFLKLIEKDPQSNPIFTSTAISPGYIETINNKTIMLRSTSFPYGRLLIQPHKLTADVCVLVIIECNKAWCAGWISKNEFKNIATVQSRVRTLTLGVDQDELHPLSELVKSNEKEEEEGTEKTAVQACST